MQSELWQQYVIIKRKTQNKRYVTHIVYSMQSAIKIIHLCIKLKRKCLKLIMFYT